MALSSPPAPEAVPTERTLADDGANDDESSISLSLTSISPPTCSELPGLLPGTAPDSDIEAIPDAPFAFRRGELPDVLLLLATGLPCRCYKYYLGRREPAVAVIACFRLAASSSRIAPSPKPVVGAFLGLIHTLGPHDSATRFYFAKFT